MSASAKRVCGYCQFSMPIVVDRCPACARPSLFPNVDMASTAAEEAALDGRYDTAMSTATANGAAMIATGLEQEVSDRSRVVISRDASEVYRLASRENQLYTTFYNLVEAGVQLPTDSKWDAIRPIVDMSMFPYVYEEVRFGALTLDREEAGLPHYGNCHMVLKTDLIHFRTSVFTENSVVLFIKSDRMIPVGHRATWHRRGRLAVAKLAAALASAATPSDFPGILKVNGATSDEDAFIEAHVYGSISMHTVEQVTIPRKTDYRWKAFKEKLEKAKVAFVVR